MQRRDESLGIDDARVGRVERHCRTYMWFACANERGVDDLESFDAVVSPTDLQCLERRTVAEILADDKLAAPRVRHAVGDAKLGTASAPRPRSPGP